MSGHEPNYDEMTKRGLVTSHCSDPDGGMADIGISLGLGEGKMLWAGEISDTRHAETEDAAALGSSNGWWLILYSRHETEVIAKFLGDEPARVLIDRLSAVLRDERAAEAAGFARCREMAAELGPKVYLDLIAHEPDPCPCGNGRIPTGAYRTAVNAYNTAIRALPDAQPPSASVWRQWRHKKRGTHYDEIGLAKLQASVRYPREGDTLVLYRDHQGTVWAREYCEFHDGRFERVPATLPPPPDQPPSADGEVPACS